MSVFTNISDTASDFIGKVVSRFRRFPKLVSKKSRAIRIAFRMNRALKTAEVVLAATGRVLKSALLSVLQTAAAVTSFVFEVALISGLMLAVGWWISLMSTALTAVGVSTGVLVVGLLVLWWALSVTPSRRYVRNHTSPVAAPVAA